MEDSSAPQRAEKQPENEIPEQVEKLAPFALRSKALEVGRQRLAQVAAKLRFVWVTRDISENSLRKCREMFRCPMVQVGQSTDFDRLFSLLGTKLIGFRRSSLSDNLYRELQSFQLPQLPPRKRAETPKDSPKSEVTSD